MKKFKKYLAMFLSALMVMTLCGIKPAEVKAEEDVTAHLSFASSDWGVQYWYDGNEYPVTATNVQVTGYGQYTVGLDFTTCETETVGCAFADVEISNAETIYPGAIMTIDSLKINGTEVEVGKSYTCSDNGKDMRVNLYNEWVGDPATEPTNPRTADGDMSTALAVVFDRDVVEVYQTIEVTFTLSEGDPDASAQIPADKPEVTPEPLPEEGTTSYISFASSDWGVQYWYDGNEYPLTANNTQVTGYGQYTVGLDFTTGDAGSAASFAFIDVEIAGGEKYFPNATMTINSIKINGEEVEYLPGYTCSDNGSETRVNIYNSWCTGSPADVDGARVAEGSLEDTTYMMIDPANFEEVKTIEVTYTLAEGAETPDAGDGDSEPVPTESAIKEEGYTTFIMFMDQSEKWTHTSAGTAGDIIVKGDGTFEITLTPEEVGASSAADGAKVFCIDMVGFAAAMQEIGVQTDNIDKSKNKLTSDVTVDVDVYVDGTKIKLDDSKLLYGNLEDKGTFRIEIYNEWGSGTKDNSPLLYDKITPASELKVIFTLSGTGFIDEEHQAAITPEATPTATPVPTEAADNSKTDGADTDGTKTDNSGAQTSAEAEDEGGISTGTIVVIVIVVIAVIAVAVVVVSKKKGGKTE